MPVLLATPLPRAVEARARAAFGCDPAGSNLSAAEVAAAAAAGKVRAIVISSRQKLDAGALAALPPEVGLIATTSVGFDHLDLGAAAARGVAVTNTPDVLTDATAELTMLLLLGAARRAREYQRIMEAGWRRSFALHEMLGTQLSGKRLGIVGMGRIGRAVAERARGFGMRIDYHNRRRLDPARERGARWHADLDAMLPVVDVLSLHLPGAGSAPLMTRERFARLRPGAIFVNTARGSLVDEEALVEALGSGHLAGAGLDVFRAEPAYDLRLRDQPRAFLTPHMGSATLETREAMGARALDNVAAFLAGATPPDLVGGH
ncbi:2-hydroxyacid dehydrogenase [Amaricoccus solimangrovi]|uniref:D-glycerate dehydrogenase n=1 Tax=Amaricoccus solimangrovi TaxID=2589815 RepID=A0A501WKL9_9RHOB|nr:D-glycerate dehydrogenase [Amaricoccus solimangrovi]TPE48975.1 D-glycerate dehydrogenase [Amaricoccus solimangrovi]